MQCKLFRKDKGGTEWFLVTGTNSQLVESIEDTTFTDFVIRTKDGGLVKAGSRSEVLAFLR